MAGLAADNLLGAQVVLADASVVDADDSCQPDLMWALRGGGGNFGVVTSMQVRLHPIPKVYRGQVLFPLDQAAEVLVGYGQLLADAPDRLTSQAVIVTTPDGMPVLLVSPTWSGDADEGDHWLKRLAGLGQPAVAAASMVDYAEPLRQGDALFAPDQRRYATRTRNLAALTPEAVRALVDAAAGRTSPLSAISVHHFHGAACRVAVDTTAFGTRQEHFMVAPATAAASPVQQVMAYAPPAQQVAADVMIVTNHHTRLTHLDALSHQAIDGLVYPGRSFADSVTPAGATHASMTTFASGVITRGILLDLAADGPLPRGYPVTGRDLDAAREREGATLKSGDPLVVRGGWSVTADPPRPGLATDAVGGSTNAACQSTRATSKCPPSPETRGARPPAQRRPGDDGHAAGRRGQR